MGVARPSFATRNQSTVNSYYFTMKKNLFFIFFIVLCSTSFKGFATDQTFTGTDGDWHTASNWSPSGVPGNTDRAFIPAGISVTVSSDTEVGAINVDGTDAQLAVNSGVTLTISGTTFVTAGFNSKITITNNAKLINSGTIDFPLSAEIQTLFMIRTSGNLTNTTSGAITYHGPASRVSLKAIFLDVGTIVNNGLIDINCAATLIGVRPGMEATNGSTGTITGSSKYLADLDQAAFHNYGLIHKSGAGLGNISVPSGSTFTNYGCARLITGDLDVGGLISNSGYLIASGNFSGIGSITNNGVYISTGTPTITNNKLIVNNSTPIFSYGASNDFTVDGIYKDSAALASAGTFTAPNSFSPSGTLPAGSQTLYAKITAAGGSCSYTVPFTYQMTALPVTLVSFAGRKTAENQNTLAWVTADEKEFGYFEIQRSSDAKSFEAIGRVNGTENKNSSLNSYKFIDNLARGYNYYRLKMVDRAANGRDGSYELSKIISIENSSENTVVGNLYPNPATEIVYVDIYTEKAENWNITLVGLNGKEIYTKTRSLQKGMNTITLDNPGKGVRLMHFDNGKIQVVRKLVSE